MKCEGAQIGHDTNHKPAKRNVLDCRSNQGVHPTSLYRVVVKLIIFRLIRGRPLLWQMRHPLRSNSRPWPITVSRKSDASVLVSVETSRVSCRLPGMAQRVGFESFPGCYCPNLSGAKSN